MAVIALTVPATAAKAPARKHAVLKCGKLSLTLPCTSAEARLTGIGAEWTQIDRPGDAPLLRKAKGRLRQIELDVYFADQLGSRDIEADLARLDAFGNSDEPVVVSYGKLEAGYWRLTDVTPTSKTREPQTNRVTRLDATLTFLEMIPTDSAALVTATKPPAKTTSKKKKTTTRARVYTVKTGDTLSKIAAHFYHNANLWPRIAKANKLRNANHIYPGQRLTIP